MQQTIKNIIYIIFVLCLISCSENGDKYVGNYASKYKYAIVKKAGDEGYFLTFGKKHGDEYSYYCIYKKGCFIRVNKNGEFPVMCVNGNGLISNEGINFRKVRNIITD